MVVSSVKNITPFKKPAPLAPAPAPFNPFARKYAGQHIVGVTVFSFMLMCLVVGSSIAYTPHVRSNVFAFVSEANATLEVANEAMFGTYLQLAGAAITALKSGI